MSCVGRMYATKEEVTAYTAAHRSSWERLPDTRNNHHIHVQLLRTLVKFGGNILLYYSSFKESECYLGDYVLEGG